MAFTIRLPRILTHHRAFSACVILSLGVGISAAAAVIAVVDSMKFAKLPFANADRLEVLSYRKTSEPNSRWTAIPAQVAHAVKTGGSPVVDVAQYASERMRVRDGEHEADDVGTRVTPNFATVLGPRMMLGRAFGASDIGTPSVVISYAFFTSTLGSDSTIVGRTIEVNGSPAIVAGVAAREWVFPTRSALWLSDATFENSKQAASGLETLVLLEHPTTAADRVTIATRATVAYYEAKTWREKARPEITMSPTSLRDYVNIWLSFIMVALTILLSSIGPLRAMWKRDLAQVLRI